MVNHSGTTKGVPFPRSLRSTTWHVWTLVSKPFKQRHCLLSPENAGSLSGMKPSLGLKVFFLGAGSASSRT